MFTKRKQNRLVKQQRRCNDRNEC